MKKRNPLYFAVLITLVIGACTPTQNNTSEATLTEKNTITLDQYQNWQGAWKDKGVEYTDSVLTEYFTMDLVDLREFSHQSNVAARFVLGLDTTIIPAEPHLMLVGVDSTGTSMLPSTKHPNYHIYDVTLPCPRYCGSSSLPKS